MKSFVRVMLVVLLTTSFAAVACGEMVFLDRRPGATDGLLEQYDGDGTLAKTYASSFSYPEGIGLSPDKSTIYVVELYTRVISSYNVQTGAAGTTYTLPGKDGNPLDATYRASGLAVDPDTGNIFCAVYNFVGSAGWIDKVIVSTGEVVHKWGSSVAASSSRLGDLEIYDGNVYGSLCWTTSNLGVYTWDLSVASGATPALVTGTSGYRGDGLAINPSDGTLYAYDWTDQEITKWTAGVPTVIHDLEAYSNDIDYFDGHLYVGLYNTKHGFGKLDLSDNSFTQILDISLETAKYVKYVAVIPEPGTLALLATGLIGLLAYAWRKRK